MNSNFYLVIDCSLTDGNNSDKTIISFIRISIFDFILKFVLYNRILLKLVQNLTKFSFVNCSKNLVRINYFFENTKRSRLIFYANN